MPLATDPAAAETTTYSATLHYSEPLLRQAVAGFWRRIIGVWFPIAMVVLVWVLATLLMQGDTSWKTGALAVFIAIAVSVAISVYVTALRGSLRQFRALKTPEAFFGAGESSFTFTSETGTGTLGWAAVTQLWRFRHFWLLSMSKTQFITLPLADVAPEMQDYVLQRVRSAGGKIDGRGR